MPHQPLNVLDVYNPRHEQLKDIYLVEKISSNEGWIPASPEEGWSLGYGRELRNFIECIREKQTPESDLELALDVTLAIYAGMFRRTRWARIRCAAGVKRCLPGTAPTRTGIKG